MIRTTPLFEDLLFVAIAFAVVFFLHYAIDRGAQKPGNKTSLFAGIIILLWLFATAVLSYRGYLTNFEARPPRLIPFVALPMLTIVYLFLNKKTREFIGRMPITTLTYIHIVRVPVEIVLWWLFLDGLVAQEMTFEGANYDIIVGISAPFAAVFLVGARSKTKWSGILWNIVSIGLLINIVIRAILLTPYFHSPESGENMNVAVFYFPYIWLPSFIVPAVLFSHVASLYQLFRLEK
jgi:hypothetical protein